MNNDKKNDVVMANMAAIMMILIILKISEMKKAKMKEKWNEWNERQWNVLMNERVIMNYNNEKLIYNGRKKVIIIMKPMNERMKIRKWKWWKWMKR